MKKKYFILTWMLLLAQMIWAQTTENFETETSDATSFTDNGQVFNITSQAQGPFSIQDDYPSTGWGGSSADNRYIDNDGDADFNIGVQFTITAAGNTPFQLKSMYLFISRHDLNLNVSGSVTIVGRLGGVEQFSATASSPFNTSMAVNNGFTFINMSTFGGENNADINIDQFIISTTSGINYIALDAMTWQCAAVSVSQASQTNVSCNGGNNGSATVSASGGSGFTYNWTPGNPAGDGTATVTGLTAGSWTCTVTNSCGSSNSTMFTITQPAVLTASQSQNNVPCPGFNSGSATVNPSGGTAPYTYSWSPSGGSAATATGLAPGNYTVTITDSKGCSIQRFFTITDTSTLTASTSQTNVICNGASTGSASVVPSGGTGPYTFSWSGGGTAATKNNLAAGNYTVTITDANGCSIQRNFTITTAADCSIATAWNGTSWSNGTPTCNAYTVTINGNYNSTPNGEITACSLTVNSGNVIVAGGHDFTIKGAVTVAGGTLTFNQNSNLVQADDVANSGIITYKRNTSALYDLDYTLWSSPVSGTQTLKDFSPQTLDERFYVYNTALNAYSNYESASGIFGGMPDEETFDIAKGYLIRMPDGTSETTPTVFNGSFTGTPNNGDISIALNTQGNRYNAVGNPYPSPVNIHAFLNHNQTNLDNGTLYFWRKRNAATGTAYATVTLAAYVAATAEGGDTSGGAFNAGNEANWVINPGQGFFVKAAPAATVLEFTNSMRRNVNNGQFFRNGTLIPPPPADASKLWLNITNEFNDFGQTAIAYTDVTTMGLDYGYDGRLYNDGVIAIYTIAENTKLAIQAREAFHSQDEVALGYKAERAGNYSIGLHQYTGVFEQGQDIYLKDNLLDVEHDLKNDGAYSFTSSDGTFTDRFNVIYSSSLGTNMPEADVNAITVTSTNNTIAVSSAQAEIQSIVIYDICGRIVYQNEGINSLTTQITGLNIEKQVLIVQVSTGEKKHVRKIIY
jgi:hypothetical protein